MPRKRPRGRPRKYPPATANADACRAYRQRKQSRFLGWQRLPQVAAKLRRAIAQAKARGELPHRHYAVFAIGGKRTLSIVPDGVLTGAVVSEAEIRVLMTLAARYATPDNPFGLHIEGTPATQQHSLEA
jgi:hypothetical protein